MGLFDSILEIAAAVTTIALPIRLTDDTLNKAASGLIKKDGTVRAVHLTTHDGWCQADSHIKHKLSEFDLKVEFEITRFEVSKQVQVIELKQRTPLLTDADGWKNKVMLTVIKIIISAFLGKNLLQFELDDMAGVTVAGDIITVDLTKAGATIEMYAAIADKVILDAPLLAPLLRGGVEALAERIAITGAECQAGALVVNIKYVGTK